MKAFINALAAGNLSGTGRVAGELCRALAKLSPEETKGDRFLCLVEDDYRHRAELETAPSVEVIAQPRRSPLRRILWESFHLSALVRRLLGAPASLPARPVRRAHADVFHAPAFIAPPRLPCPSVVTIHDCAFIRYPQTIRLLHRIYYRRAIPRSAREAARVAVDSESTRRDVIELMRLDPAKLRVVPLGVGEEFFVDRVAPETEARLRRIIGAGGPFLLTVGTMEPRKNLDTLIRAYARLRAQMPDAPPLVIAGRRGWFCGRLETLTHELGLGDSVRFPGFIPDDDLPSLLALATVFVCVSLYEGFGLPALEAMAAGAPVVASNASSLPEVIGSAGALVNPSDAESIARSLQSLLRSSDDRARRIESGRRQARQFPWQRCALSMLDIYRETAQND
ncbi:MAG: glycosyltransferase family 1 protein [Candidatus Sumerlaeota bacterium]|nr:glycosyltransferase family 1 protein [Candidatus Sumerlaeota bacterium]